MGRLLCLLSLCLSVAMASDIHRAAGLGDVETIRVLLAQGVDVDTRDEGQRTPLHVAASANQPSAVFALLDNGADIEARNYCGETPLHLAAGCNHGEAIEALLSEGACIEAKCWASKTSLHLAAHNASITGNTAGLRCLLLNRADANARDDYGYRPGDCFNVIYGQYWSTVRDIISNHPPQLKSLKQCARTCIRSQLVRGGANTERKLKLSTHQLPLPTRLKTYLGHRH